MIAHRILVMFKDLTDAPIKSMGTAVNAYLVGLEPIVKIVSTIYLFQGKEVLDFH